MRGPSHAIGKGRVSSQASEKQAREASSGSTLLSEQGAAVRHDLVHRASEDRSEMESIAVDSYIDGSALKQ